MDCLSTVLSQLRLSAGVFVHARFCGRWAVDTSGQRMATFHLIEHGDCWLHVPDQAPRALAAGDLVVFPRDGAHVVSATADAPAAEEVNAAPQAGPEEVPDNAMLCGYFEFQGTALLPLLDGLPDAIVIEVDNRYTRPLIQLLMRELTDNAPGADAVIDFYAHALFVQALRAVSDGAMDQGLVAALRDPALARALAAMHTSPGERWTLEGLAALAHLGRTAFAERFRRLVGVSPMRYLQRWRLQIAAEKLRSTRLSMAAIAEEIGYDSEVAFRKAFRREMGITPGRLRRQGAG